MLQHKRGTKRAAPAPAPAPSGTPELAAIAPDAAGSPYTFGASMLQQRKGRAKLVVALVLLAAAIAAVCVTSRGGASSAKPAAAAQPAD
jgi:hypothetical protein